MKRRTVLGMGAAIGASTALPAQNPPTIYRPGDPGYAEEIAAYDLSLTPRPGLVVAARSPHDVRAGVRLAARRGAPVAVFATGHQWAVPVGPDAVLVSTRHLTDVRIDVPRRLAYAQAGALMQQVVDEAATAGLAPLAGSTGGVSVAGYTLGGGLSPMLGRRYGYAADHVRSVDLVTADGRLRTTTADDDPDLFFGVRGGKSNFGIATALVFDLFPVASYYGGAIFFDGKHAGRLLHAYRTWTATAPDTMSSSVALLRMPDAPAVPAPLRGRTVVSLRICHVGRADEGAALVAPLRAIAPALLDGVATSPFTAFNTVHGDPPGPQAECVRTTMLRDLPVEALLSAAGPRTSFPSTLVEIRHLGGALARRPDPANAIGNRDAAFILFTAGPNNPAVRRSQSDLIDQLTPWSTRGLYPNFMGTADSSPASVRHSYEPAVYDRLRTLKRRVDPDNMFRLNQNIPPA